MASLRRWRQVGQGQFLRWETPGQELEGVWVGQHDGAFGPLGTVDTREGRMTFPLHAALLGTLQIDAICEHLQIAGGRLAEPLFGRAFEQIRCALDRLVQARGGPEIASS